MDEIDITIIGAGVIGLAAAAAVARERESVFVFEKNKTFGEETSSRNSEVIHAGIYYGPGSLKARLCVRGKELLYRYLKTHNVPYRRTGKLIVAASESETEHVQRLYKRGEENGVDGLRMIGADDLARFEPRVRGVAALLSPSTGIFDTHAFMRSLYAEGTARGADFLFQSEIVRCEPERDCYRLAYRDNRGREQSFFSRIVINCAGLQADRVAELAGIDRSAAGYRQYYCKGEYFRLCPEKSGCVSRLIYPVPDDASLGVHLTPDMAGGVRVGPNAVYIDRERLDYAVDEKRRGEFCESVQRLVPSLTTEDIMPDTAGVRPKLQGPRDDVRDFVIAHEAGRGLPGLINLIGIESPGLTASLAIAERVAEIAALL